MADRTAVSLGQRSLTYGDLDDRARAAAAHFAVAGAKSVVYVGPNHLAFPVALFGAALAGLPFVPMNYRLGQGQLACQIADQPSPYVLGSGAEAVAGSVATVGAQDFLEGLDGVVATDDGAFVDPELPALQLYTSGTTSAPKVAILRHRHLMAYLISTVEFASAGPEEANLVTVPPYHIAGVANLLSNIYAGRRIVYLDGFDPGLWLTTVRDEQVTHAMVIPTMLARIVQQVGEDDDAGTPTLRALSYGGSRIPAPVLRRALEVFPSTDFVNAYGLTETSSTIALLDPEDHRGALRSPDPALEKRLGSVGRLLPGIELEVRDDGGNVLEVGDVGLIFVRGEQVSGEYRGASALDENGWFATRDRGWIDADGYLFIEGRADDTIIRGGENIAPAEIEDVLLTHPAVTDAVVVGIPDDEWGQRLAAAVVVRGALGSVSEDELREWTRARLRSSKTPDVIEFWQELPRTDTGKLTRREVVARLSSGEN